MTFVCFFRFFKTFYRMLQEDLKKCQEKSSMRTTQRCYIEQILEAAPHKTAAVQLLISHLTNHTNKMSKTCWVLQKKGQIHKWHSPTYE